MDSCIICDSRFEKHIGDSYNRCISCGSYIYVSESSSADLNKEFYNNLLINNYHVDLVKKNIFYFYKSLDKLIKTTDYREFDVNHAVLLGVVRESQKNVLEVGFWTGDNLVNLLRDGIDAYGIDISESNVASFVKKYPQHASRVSCSTRIDRQIDIVYTSALFEHLDDPQDFIDNISSSLSPGGIIVLDNIPVVNDRTSSIPPASDICFWDGIHKAVYTKQAIIEFAVRNGYELSSYGHLDYFTYRVLSAHKFFGYSIIEDIRHPFMSGDKLPALWDYIKLCYCAVTMDSAALLGFATLKKTA